MTQRYRSSFSLFDGVLVTLAVLGLIVFAVLLPGQHPYSAADYSEREAALDQAVQFLELAGFAPPAGSEPKAEMRVDGPALDTLQQTLGRAAAISRLRSAEGKRQGVFYWRVVWPDPAAVSEDLAYVHLTLDGQVMELEVLRPTRFGQAAPTGEADGLPAPGDSLAGPAPPAQRLAALLRQTRYAGWGLQVDSVEASTDLYRAYLSGPVEAGDTIRVEARLNPMGHLMHLEADARGERAAHATSPRDLYSITMLVLYVLLLIGVMVAFFRRLSQRLVDTRAALRDALWVALAGTGWMLVTVIVPVLQSVPSVWLAVGIILFNILLGGLGTAFILFAASGAGDSIARATWPERLTSLSLLRIGAWYDGRVGAALVRGLAGAGLTMGLITLQLMLLQQGSLYLGGAGSPLAGEAALSPALFLACFYTIVGLFQLYAVVLVTGGALKRWLGVGVYGLMAVLLTAMQLSLLSSAPGWQFVFHLAPVAVVLWLFHRYDALTAFVSLFAYSVLWDLTFGWIAPEAPGQTDAFILFGVLAALFAIGLVVMIRGKRVTHERVLVPSYVREREHEARLERELEIAHNVQMNFLPRRMPRVDGLDVAALCLPASEVGGDYYDFVKLADDRLALVIGDVSGKGIQAAFYMTLVKGFVRTLATDGLPPVEVLRRVNRLFYECAPRGTFVSMIYGVVDVPRRTFTFARAGHNPVILHRAPSQQADMLQPPGLAIGLDPGLRFDAALTEETLRLGLGDTIVLYTDGFSEAMDPERALFGDERLAEEASELQGPSARHLLDALTRSVNAFMQGTEQHDDMTMIVLRFTAAASSAARTD